MFKMIIIINYTFSIIYVIKINIVEFIFILLDKTIDLIISDKSIDKFLNDIC